MLRFAKHHPQLYIHNGDLVIQANPCGNSTKFEYFRVHRARVGRMSHLPSSGSYDGVPLVRVAETADVVAELLNVLYDQE